MHQQQQARLIAVPPNLKRLQPFKACVEGPAMAVLLTGIASCGQRRRNATQ